MRLDYVFTEGTVAPYDVMFDTIHPVPATPVSISTSESAGVTGYGYQRKHARLSNGTLYAVYTKHLAGKYQIYVKKSADGGATWTDETRISTYSGMAAGNQYAPSIAVDSNDYLHVGWMGEATGYGVGDEQMWYSKYITRWSTPVRLSTIAGMEGTRQFGPSIAVDSDDYLHIVWESYGPTGGVWYTKYITSWSTPVKISGPGFYLREPSPSIAIDSNTHLHVVYYGRTVGDGFLDFQIWYALYDGSWHTPVRISTYSGMEDYRQSMPSSAIDSNDHLHVVWEGRATGYTTANQIWYALYDGSWHTPVRISIYSNMASYSQAYPSIAIDEDDNFHVLWDGKASGYTDYDKIWYTDSWSTPKCLQPTGKNKYPNLRWSRWPPEAPPAPPLPLFWILGPLAVGTIALGSNWGLAQQ